MGMYSLIEDAQTKALEAANCWAETDEARELIAKIEAFEVLSDRWCGECPQAAEGFMQAAREAEDALEDMRAEMVVKAATLLARDTDDLTYDYAWEAADEDAPPVKQILNAARRDHAGNGYLERFAA